jgi:uncharacterized membrane-anchored protein
MATSKLLLFTALVSITNISAAQESTDVTEIYSSLNFTAGPGTYDVTPRATIELSADYDRLDASDTKKLMELMENPSDGRDYYVAPVDERWFSIFSYEDTGHVKDDEEIDANALLDSLREGTKIGNRERARRGWAELHIVGWQYRPTYNDTTNRLSWAVLAESEGQEIVNYNTRLLGRTGVISATLVAEPAVLDVSVTEFENLLNGFQYKSGDTYAEYRAGDKLATYGLAALVTGGAAAAVAKGAGKGLFKAIGVGILAFFAFVGGAIRKMFSRN